MGLIPDPKLMMSMGGTRLLRALRSGDQSGLYLGAGLLALGWYRGSRGPKRILLRRIVVKEGQSLVVRSGTDQAHVDVRRVDDRPT